jgi:nicotinamide mononucleotide transporter
MDLTNAFVIGPITTSPVELIAVLFGLLSVWFMKKESILCFPFGMINVLIYVYLCYREKLYAYAGINVFFFIMSIYGWYNWTRHSPGKKPIRITRCPVWEIILNMAALTLFFVFLRYLLREYTDSELYTWDALTTAIYIIGQWLLSLKKIENWIMWITGDIISIWLFAYQGLFFSSFQFFIFTIIATLGFLEWRIKLMK